MIAAVHGIYGETRAKCGRLCRDSERRAEWGCDVRAPAAIFRATCPACMGGGCAKCEGAGEAYVHRCPNSFVDRRVRALFDAYAWLERGTLPVSGALGDQAAAFVEGVRLIDSERAMIAEANARSDG